jgi:hypothetical protein
MLAAIGRALRLTLAERDHLYRLAGHTPPRSDVRTDHVGPGMQRVLDRLDTPAMVTNDLGEVLAQNPLGVALIGDETRFAPDDPDRSRFHCWFTDPADARYTHPRSTIASRAPTSRRCGSRPAATRTTRAAGRSSTVCWGPRRSSRRCGLTTTSSGGRASSPRRSCTRRWAALSSTARRS